MYSSGVCKLIRSLFRSNIANMNTLSTVNSGSDKRLPETTVQTVAQNLTTMQNVQNVQNVQSVVQSSTQNIQPIQTIVGPVGTPGNLVGKSVSLDINPKLSLMKPVTPSGAISSVETSKITTTVILVYQIYIINISYLSQIFFILHDRIYFDLLILHYKCKVLDQVEDLSN